jgi:hypothetical protein
MVIGACVSNDLGLKLILFAMGLKYLLKKGVLNVHDTPDIRASAYLSKGGKMDGNIV